MAGRSPVTASEEQKAALRALAASRDCSEEDPARAVLLTLAGWTVWRRDRTASGRPCPDTVCVNGSDRSGEGPGIRQDDRALASFGCRVALPRVALVVAPFERERRRGRPFAGRRLGGGGAEVEIADKGVFRRQSQRRLDLRVVAIAAREPDAAVAESLGGQQDAVGSAGHGEHLVDDANAWVVLDDDRSYGDDQWRPQRFAALRLQIRWARLRFASPPGFGEDRTQSVTRCAPDQDEAPWPQRAMVRRAAGGCEDRLQVFSIWRRFG